MNLTESDSEDITKIIGKKFLINEWKDTTLPKISGIYKICNVVDNKYYVGSSENIFARWNKHIRKLSDKTHHNDYLLNAWHKHGSHTFTFELIELSELCDLLSVEQNYLDVAYTEQDLCYNLKFNATGGKLSKYSAQKISDKMRGRKLSDEHKNKVRQYHLIHKTNQSEETKHKLSLKSLGRKVSDHTKQKLSLIFKNKKPTELQLQRCKDAIALKTKIYKFENLLTAEIYQGTRSQFRNKFELNKTHVKELLNGKRTSLKHWVIG